MLKKMYEFNTEMYNRTNDTFFLNRANFYLKLINKKQ